MKIVVKLLSLPLQFLKVALLNANLLEMAENLLSVNKFLSKNSSDGEHGNSSVLELLGLD